MYSIICSCTFHVSFLTYFGSCLFLRLSSNSEIANRIATEVVTKPETVTLEELFSYIKQEASKVLELICFYFRFHILGYLLSFILYFHRLLGLSAQKP